MRVIRAPPEFRYRSVLLNTRRQPAFYAGEVRDFGAIAKGEGARLSPGEFELATGLMDKLSNPEFEPKAYSDVYRAQVLSMIEQKAKGREVIAPRTPPRGQVIDIYAALKQSLENAKSRVKTERSRRKKAQGSER